MKERKGSVLTKVEDCIVENMRSGRCKNGSYYRKFSVNYYDDYIDDKGETVYVNMRQWVVGFNEVAREVKANIKEGDRVYLIGRLKSRPIENYAEESFIEVEETKDIVKLPKGWEDESG